MYNHLHNTPKILLLKREDMIKPAAIIIFIDDDDETIGFLKNIYYTMWGDIGNTIMNIYKINKKMDIKELKSNEMQEIINFFHHVEDYGHIFHFEPERLDRPFKKIMDGISEIREMMDDSYGV